MLQQAAPYLGYLASLCLIIALLVKTELGFRIYNIAGTVFFITYGILSPAWPVVIANAILFFINLFAVYRLSKYRENFDVVRIAGDEPLMLKFFSFYRDDLQTYFPGFNASVIADNLNFAVLRDLVIANVFSATVLPDGDAQVHLNYTVKKYRDYRVGEYIFTKEKQFLISCGVKRIVYTSVASRGHEKFLVRNGFTKYGAGYARTL